MEAHVSGIGTHIELASSNTEPSFVSSAPTKRYVAFANGVIGFSLVFGVVCLAGLAATQVSIRHFSKGVVRIGCYTRVR